MRYQIQLSLASAICCNLFVYGFNCIWFLFSIWQDPFTPGPNKALNIPSLFDPWEKEEAVNPVPGTHSISSCTETGCFCFFSYWQRFSSAEVINSKSTVLQISKTQMILIVEFNLGQKHEWFLLKTKDIADIITATPEI